MPADVMLLRSEFLGLNETVPIKDGRRVVYVNFDNAATTPPLKAVVAAVNAFLPWYSSVHRGFGYKSQLSTGVYNRARDYITRFFGADPGKDLVVFVKNATEALNKLSYRLKTRQNQVILASRMEHHSNDLPWRLKRKTLFAELPPDGRLDLADLENKLRNNRVALVTLCGASNVTGVINPLRTIAEMTHYYGAAFLVDAAQLVPHRPLRLRSGEAPDFIAFSGHKLYAPFGSGVLLGPAKVFAEGIPELTGGGTVAAVSKTRILFAPPPEREEAGTPNLIGAFALAKALQWLQEHDFPALATYEENLTKYAYNRLATVPGIRLYGPPPFITPRVGVIAFNLEGIPHSLVAAALAYEAGIGVRHGCFCARPYVHHLLRLSPAEIAAYEERIAAGKKQDLPGMVRVSFGFYNTREEVDRLIAALFFLRDEEVKIKKSYRLNPVTGEYLPPGGDYQVRLDRHRESFFL
ncbi:MAG: aminotransferase class V-fold PLP-dependent enzyme [Firmicutes bacterium]|nr:aminotransferase class V-fold PLP-dependent enzyme [Bacillota bacterium]